MERSPSLWPGFDSLGQDYLQAYLVRPPMSSMYSNSKQGTAHLEICPDLVLSMIPTISSEILAVKAY